MNERPAIACIVASLGVLVAASPGCGIGDAPKERAGGAASRSTDTPPAGSIQKVAETLVGVGVPHSDGPPLTPATPSACIKLWNSSANAGTRRSVLEDSPTPRRALVRIGRPGDYFGAAGRCVVWITGQQPDTATVFLERAPGAFLHAGDGSGLIVTPDLALDARGRIAA